MVERTALGVLSLVVLFLPVPAAAQSALRVATWNIEDVGAPDSLEYAAALNVLGRIGADVVALNEIAGATDATYLESLASDAGYPYLGYAAGAAFGSDRSAILSHYPFVGSVTEHDSASLSGDAAANDITRSILEAVIDLPGYTRDLTVVAAHWKSGTGNDDEFRRVVESYRIAQAIADLDSATDAYIVLGDINEEIDSTPRTPNPFSGLPTGLPASFSLGSDLAALLALGALANDPFASLEADPGTATTAALALQLDGLDATRPASGRRLDYILLSDALAAAGVATEVYDSQDEGQPGGLPKAGTALAAAASLDASDHLVVFADITVAAKTEAIPALGGAALAGLAMALLAAGARKVRFRN